MLWLGRRVGIAHLKRCAMRTLHSPELIVTFITNAGFRSPAGMLNSYKNVYLKIKKQSQTIMVGGTLAFNSPRAETPFLK